MTNTIDLGIGTVTYKTDGNLLLTHMMDYFSDLCRVKTPHQIIAILSAAKEPMDDDIKMLDEELKDKNREIERLEKELEPFADFESPVKIDCGIGTIHYSADNLLLNDLMEDVETLIKNKTPLKAKELISQLN